MMQGTFELKPEYPKVGRDFNTTKIQRHRLPASDPLSLHLARQVMQHPVVPPSKRKDPMSEAMLMIGGGANPRFMLSVLATQPDWAVAASQPFSVTDDRVYTRKYEGVAEVAPHLYHVMFKRNHALWDRAGVTKAFRDAADREARDMEVREGDAGSGSERENSLKANTKGDISRSDWRVGMPEAVQALAEYITKRGDAWRDEFVPVTNHELKLAYKEVQRYGISVETGEDA